MALSCLTFGTVCWQFDEWKSRWEEKRGECAPRAELAVSFFWAELLTTAAAVAAPQPRRAHRVVGRQPSTETALEELSAGHEYIGRAANSSDGL